MSYISVEDFKGNFKKYKPLIHGVRLPELQNINGDHYEYLKKLCSEKIREKISKGKIDSSRKEEYISRGKYELETINNLGFTDYILLVYDYVNYARTKDIPVGKGRGSGAGSLVNYLLGITDIDPIVSHLLFERFLSATRAGIIEVDGIKYLDGGTICDLDTDFCKQRRPEVIQYLKDKYVGKTANILTLGTLSGKSLIKECGKIVAEREEKEMNRVSSLIPKLHGHVMDIEDAYKEEPEFKKWCDENSKAYRIALKLRDLIKSKGCHASGILVSYENIDSLMPLSIVEGELISGYSMESAMAAVCKIDCLGLLTLTQLSWMARKVGISCDDIDIHDQGIYEYLSNPIKGTVGLFQSEEGMGSRVLSKILPQNIQDCSLAIATSRPGSFKFADVIAEHKKNGTIHSYDPRLDDTLKSTYGIIVYQEQIMALCNKMAGFNLRDTDAIRKGVGKKDKAKLALYKPKFIEGCKNNGFDEQLSEKIWQVFEDSGDYLFNASHSMAYSYILAQTAYFKHYYPLYFYAGLLNYPKKVKGNPESYYIGQVVEEMRRFGYNMLPPDITFKEFEFQVREDRNAITGNLGKIKGIAESALEKLNNFIGNVYTTKISVFAAAKNCGLNITVLTNLIRVGCFDNFVKNEDRARMVIEAKLFNMFNAREKIWATRFASEFEEVHHLIKHLYVFKDEKGKQIISEARIKKLRDEFKKINQDYLDTKSLLQNWRYEKALLGYSYSSSLYQLFEKDYEIKQIKDLENGNVAFVAFVCEPAQKISKNENEYISFLAREETGSLKILCFGDCYKNLKKEDVKDNDVVFISGKFNGEVVFAEQVIIKDRCNKIKVEIPEEKDVDSDEFDDNMVEI